MSMWYYESLGKAQGPVTLDWLLCEVGEGRLSSSTLVIGHGKNRWIPLASLMAVEKKQPPLSDLIEPPVDLETPEEGNKRKWVVLRKIREDDQTVFRQIGPITAEEVGHLLGEETIFPTDYIWQKGFNRWMALSETPEFEYLFQGKVISNGVEISKVISSPLLSKKVIGKESFPVFVESENEDIIQDNFEQSCTDVRTSAVNCGKKDGNKVREKLFSRRHVVWYGISASVVVFSLSLVVGWSYFKSEGSKSRQVASAPTSEVVKHNSRGFHKEIKKRKRKVSEIKPAQTRISLTRKNKRSNKKVRRKIAQNSFVATKGLDIRFSNLVGDNPQLSVFCGCAGSTTVELLISAKSGDVLKVPSYFHRMKWSSTDKTLKLRGLGLSQGAYTFVVSAGSIEKRHHVFLGKRNREFIRKLENHRKKISLQQQREKGRLYQLSKQLHSLAKDFFYQNQELKGQAWRQYLGRWRVRWNHLKSREMILMSGNKVKSLVFPVWWTTYRRHHMRLGRLAEQSVRRVASGDSGKSLLIELAQFRGQVANISTRR